MIFRLRCLPPVLGVIGAIAGVASVSSVFPVQSKAWTEYTNSVLSLERLSTINYFKVGATERTEDGLVVHLAPQSTKAIRSQFGPPSSFLEDRDIYLVRGQYDGAYASQRVIFYYETQADGLPKATWALIPNDLVKE